MGLRIGVDVGGTFTDFLEVADDGRSRIFKTSTTPSDPTIGFFNGLKKAAAASDMTVEEYVSNVTGVVHGTTITTNATLTGDGARTGFITTKGFRDVLNMRRGLKERQFEKYASPEPLIPRHLVQVVDERVDVNGNVLTPLNEDDVVAAAKIFKREKVEAIAVSLIWSFRNPKHEQRIRQILKQELPGVYVSLSTEVLPQIRVYERNSTTALNAYVGPVLTHYLSRLIRELGSQDFSGGLLIMQSNGGVMSPEVAQRYASNTLLSGPAGAPMAGVFYGQTHGFENVITVDMGGTSFDVALVKDAKPTLTSEGQIGAHRIASPILDIHTVGAGGGSIAWINSGGLLQVGPKSAGAQPGPALYGRGGKEPTVTDAQYVLGYLDPGLFEQGELNVDAKAANKAIESKIAKPLKISTVKAASGVFELVNNNMAAALESVSVQRGYDPREFVLVVAGGAGPIHAAALACELEIPLLLVPRESSVFCAAGMLISDLKHDYVRTFACDMDQVNVSELNRLFKEMSVSAEQTLKDERVSKKNQTINRSADLRYVGQFNEVEIPIEARGRITKSDLAGLANAFHKRHDALYGYSMPEDPLELINLRINALGATVKPKQEKHKKGSSNSKHALLGKRKAYFNNRFMSVLVYDGRALLANNKVLGPAIVVQPTTTIVVPPHFDLLCDEYGNYLLYQKGKNVKALIKQLR